MSKIAFFVTLFCSKLVLAAPAVFVTALPESHNPVSDVELVSVKYGTYVIHTYQDDCGSDASCPTNFVEGQRVRFVVRYESPAALHWETRQVAPSLTGLYEQEIDFLPSDFTAEQLSAIRRAGEAKGLFTLKAGLKIAHHRRPDPSTGETCEPTADQSAEDVAKSGCVRVPPTIRNVAVTRMMLRFEMNQ
jgi:hypothetical protein